MYIIILAALFSMQVDAKILKGTATTLDGKTQLYSEIHTITLDENNLNKKIETKYYKMNGDLFATMISDFSKNPLVPDIKFTDMRFDKSEELSFTPDTQIVTFSSQNGGKNKKDKEIKYTPDMAAGQGFDNFVKINFDKLQKATVPLSFGVLSEMDFFSFKGYKRSATDKKVVEFGIDLTNFFMRAFSDELVLEYESETKQILSYKGLSNLVTDEGKKQKVFIKYELK